jgi:flagellar protein FliS
MFKATQAYLQTQVTTTSQGDLVILLYDAAIKYLKQSKEKMTVLDYAGKGILISKALDVIAELDASLNQQKGGEIAVNLHKLYDFCNLTLLKANMGLDPVKIDEVIRILTGLRSAFWQINTTSTKPAEAVQAQASPASPSEVPRHGQVPLHDPAVSDQPIRARNRLAGYGA